MNIPKTTGYTEIVKIVEAALDLDRDKAIKYINKFIIKFPESDLIHPFTHLLKGKKNPSGLGHGDIIHTPHPTTLPSDEEIALKAGKRLLRLTVHDPVQRELTETEKTVSASGYIAGSKDMRSICEAKIAEMEREVKDAKRLLRMASIFYLYDIDKDGMPHAPTSELMKFWEEVKQINDKHP